MVGQSAQSATTGSLVIVGITAAVAAGHARGGRVRWAPGFACGAAGTPASVLGTRLNAHVSANVLLVCFAVLMIVAATAMLAKTMVPARPSEAAADEEAARLHTPASVGAPGGAARLDRPAAAPQQAHGKAGTALKVVVAGLVVGFLTGFLGVDGGFIIVPALVLALRYDMPTAVGTSLLVISLNSGVALLARGGQEMFHWAVIVPFTVASIAGSLGGKRVADRVSGTNLTRAFAVLLLAVAAYVLLQALFA